MYILLVGHCYKLQILIPKCTVSMSDIMCETDQTHGTDIVY